jgi:hypothetical protein
LATTLGPESDFGLTILKRIKMSNCDSSDKAEKKREDIWGASALKTIMSNMRRGLPLTRAHVEQIFPKLINASAY